MAVTKDTIIIDVLRLDEGTAPFFLNIGMHCLGCPSASGESIEEAKQRIKLEQEEKITLNKYGLLRLDYLKKHKKVEESIEEACAVHGVDADELVKQINDYLASVGK